MCDLELPELKVPTVIIHIEVPIPEYVDGYGDLQHWLITTYKESILGYQIPGDDQFIYLDYHDIMKNGL